MTEKKTIVVPLLECRGTLSSYSDLWYQLRPSDWNMLSRFTVSLFTRKD